MVSTIIEVVLKLVGWLLDKSAANQEAKRRYVEFVESYKKKKSLSAEQYDDVKKQVDDLNSSDGHSSKK